jgi:hypothetical protein
VIIDDEQLGSAFAEGDREFQYPGKVRLELRELGTLSVVSGQIVACDPLVFPETAPFEVLVPVGAYPVIASIAHIENDERIAFARIQFAEGVPTHWRHVAQDGQDVESLAAEEYFGYPVDAGTGAFMDLVAARALVNRMNTEEEYYETIIEEMEKTYVNTRSWASVTPGGSANVICFSSGYGDGSYPSFVGYDAMARVVCLLTDFQVVSGTQPRT